MSGLPPPSGGLPPASPGVSPLPGQRFVPRTPTPTLRPRKVRGGLKLESKSGPVSTAWAAQRWMRLVEDHAPGESLAEGLIYARAGQTRGMTINPGHVSARVQGRMPGAYVVDIRLPTIGFEDWERVIAAMAGEARHVASLLAGEVPASIEDLFGPLRLHLFPADESGLSLSCSCSRTSGSTGAIGGYYSPPPAVPLAPAPPKGPWCKHVCCVMVLLAERLGMDTFLIFALRGLSKEDLIERLRQRRTLLGSARSTGNADSTAVSDALSAAGIGGGSGGGSGGRAIAVYTPRLAGISDAPALPLDQCVDSFWKPAGDLADLDLTIAPPEVSHPLLRRLGPSPFAGAKFPLVGLLATCYDVIGAKTIESTMADSGGAKDTADETPTS